ncbi:rhodanese-like domain-containing protein [Halospeciosus flavus]|uniref:Rhodanese-like domain-containing protein n=1 Tax=Halospeciosus flavus TaxID=3032283 RepID=A0ABD5Z948_9EURY|nr:rhodanese-like domain-containing protein [Halospeciosus flavus]
MQRREFLATTTAVSLAGVAGCSGFGGSGSGGSGGTPDYQTNGDYPADQNPDDGRPPKGMGGTPTKRSVDESRFESLDVEGQTVTLVPLDVAHYWYARREARFADARGQTQFEASHVYGAVNSPAGEQSGSDPVLDWPKGDRVICYCGCPHHLSSLRAAALQERGYENVYVIDEGFWAWHRQGYPMRGTHLDRTPAGYQIEGQVPSKYAGEYAWAEEPETDQQEAAPIRSDGSYHLHLKFSGLTPATPIVLRTPAYTLRAPLREFTAGVVSGGD